MRVAIVVFPGSNCDRDIFEAIKPISNKMPKFVWHKETNIENFDLIIIPGGFTFGDYLRCGALASSSPIIKSIRNHASRGGAILGDFDRNKTSARNLNQKQCVKIFMSRFKGYSARYTT